MKKDKGSHVVTALLAVACIALIGAGLFLWYASRAAVEKAQTEQGQSAETPAPELYEEIVTADLFDSYPETPEEVMNFYDNTVLLLYNSGIRDPEMLKKVLSKQRALYAQELLEMNSFEEQYSKLLLSLEELSKKNVTIVGFEHVDEFYDENDGNKCVISSIQQLKGEQDLYFNYYFVKDDQDRWKIILQDSTDKDFARQ